MKKKGFKFRLERLPNKISKSFLVWIGCVLVFFAVVFIGTSGFKDDVVEYDKILGISEILGLPMGIAIVVGIVSFIIFFVSSIKFLIEKQNLGNKNVFIKFLITILAIILFPIFLAKETLRLSRLIKQIKDKGLKSVRQGYILKDLGFTVLIVLFLIPLWGSGYFAAGYILAYANGLISEPIPIAGTGSMYPTFPKGHSKDPKKLAEELVATTGMKPYPNGIRLSNINFFGHEIERGDIIVAENEKIRESSKKLYGEPAGIVKRVIALPEDKILIKDGLVYLNGKALKEPYIARPRSTFGGEFIRDCNELKIPKGKLFVMGDNRKGSGDSRHDTGLIDYKDIQYVFPYKDQLGNLDKGWHDPKDDDKESARIALNKDKYLELINKERVKIGLKPLRYEGRLELSAEKRGIDMLNYDDLSFEATRSGYTMYKAMIDSDYSNIIYGELPSLGVYEVEELFEYYFQFPETKKFLLDKDYQDIGISSVRGELNGCPANIVVIHIAGYVPPNYSKKLIESWEISLNKLREIQPGWSSLKEYSSFYNKYKSDIDRINDIISTRISKIDAIVSAMKANRWLSTDLDAFTRTGDKSLYDEQESLANKLNTSN